MRVKYRDGIFICDIIDVLGVKTRSFLQEGYDEEFEKRDPSKDEMKYLVEIYLQHSECVYLSCSSEEEMNTILKQFEEVDVD